MSNKYKLPELFSFMEKGKEVIIDMEIETNESLSQNKLNDIDNYIFNFISKYSINHNNIKTQLNVISRSIQSKLSIPIKLNLV